MSILAGVLVLLVGGGVVAFLFTGEDPEALLALPNPTPEQITGIASLLVANDFHVRMSASQRLVEIGEPALAPLLEMGSGDDREARAAALVVAGQIDENAVFGIIERLMESPEGPNHAEAMQLLNDIEPPQAPRRVELLIRALKDESPTIREAAAGQLGSTGAKEAIAPLRATFDKDPNLAVRDHAANALRWITGRKPKPKIK